jgi:hypothetical protein
MNIKIDGKVVKVGDAFSCGPGEPIHTYKIGISKEVRKIGNEWLIDDSGSFYKGSFVRPVTVEAA